LAIDGYLAQFLIALGVVFIAVSLWRLGKSLPPGPNGGISTEGGYHTPQTRWGFIAIGLLLLSCGCVMIFIR
jgi:hypothetical protein